MADATGGKFEDENDWEVVERDSALIEAAAAAEAAAAKPVATDNKHTAQGEGKSTDTKSAPPPPSLPPPPAPVSVTAPGPVPVPVPVVTPIIAKPSVPDVKSSQPEPKPASAVVVTPAVVTPATAVYDVGSHCHHCGQSTKLRNVLIGSVSPNAFPYLLCRSYVCSLSVCHLTCPPPVHQISAYVLIGYCDVVMW